ncbi:hypothetical protein QE152_g9007 [Popillia japonica]|uniref:Uncharacterized protein n=1 Tax=Popillia japonica TaxID=7064 RepID=A0AAW1M0Y1_POPJA
MTFAPPIEDKDVSMPKEIDERSTCFNKLYKDVQARIQRSYDLRHRPVSFYPNQIVWCNNFVLPDASKYYAAKLADKYMDRT